MPYLSLAPLPLQALIPGVRVGAAVNHIGILSSNWAPLVSEAPFGPGQTMFTEPSSVAAPQEGRFLAPLSESTEKLARKYT